MMRRIIGYLLFGGLPALAWSFSSHTQTPRQRDTRVKENNKVKSPSSSHRKQRRSCEPCHEFDDNDDNFLLDRREAAFAMLGTLWATSTTMYPANAAVGEEARLSFPDPLQGITDRTSKQCLVESLGNRECLVYMDQNAMLYKGADYQLLLTRVESAYGVLKDQLPRLIESKKWTQVTGVLTGPLGELVRTMIQMSKLVPAEKTALCEKQVQLVKKDLYAISAAVDKKDVSKALAAYEASVKDLAAFIVDYS